MSQQTPYEKDKQICNTIYLLTSIVMVQKKSNISSDSDFFLNDIFQMQSKNYLAIVIYAYID